MDDLIACRCLCQIHGHDSGTCSGIGATSEVFTGKTTGPVSVPMCQPCLDAIQEICAIGAGDTPTP